VLILGETGTGKELVARAIHKLSARATRAFIRVNCGAIPASALIASELSVYEKGFTGALQRRAAAFEPPTAVRSFLDEVGDLPADMQVALLASLRSGRSERVGSSRPDPRRRAHRRLTTNRDLDVADERNGSFRPISITALNVFPILVPPLRERV